jgi:hypothetical protein
MARNIKTKSVSFTQKDFDIYDFVEDENNVPNFSKYVIKLIRNDKDNIKNNIQDFSKIKEYIKLEIDKAIKNSPDNVKINNINSEELLKSIMDLEDYDR